MRANYSTSRTIGSDHGEGLQALCRYRQPIFIFNQALHFKPWVLSFNVSAPCFVRLYHLLQGCESECVKRKRQVKWYQKEVESMLCNAEKGAVKCSQLQPRERGVEMYHFMPGLPTPTISFRPFGAIFGSLGSPPQSNLYMEKLEPDAHYSSLHWSL